MEKCLERVPIILDNYGIRRLTPYECLKLQGFPSDYKFAPGTPMRKAYKQVGNSVCVPVIRRIAENIMKTMLQ
jgi:DNA (cytosine-5)-methyltransferase 1